MPRIVVSYAKRHKAERYKDALKGIGGPDAEIVDACSRSAPPRDWAALIADADGLLLTGGGDVEPRRYGETEHPEARVETDPERDAMEWSLLDAARAHRLPVFGICRGHQVINAFLGGTLWQDLGEAGPRTSLLHADPNADSDEPEVRRALLHEIEVTKSDHPLGRLLDASRPRVNSLHHQAVREPAADVTIVARGPEGIAEAMVVKDPGWWVWSVQWHPEELVEPGDALAHRTLFESFLESARIAAERRGTAAARGA